MPDPFAAFAEPAVVAADESVIVVGKPTRMHSAPGRSPGSLCSWVFSRFPDAAGAGRGSGRAEAEGGLLHRLDFETSGLVLFARSPEALAFLLREQGEGRFRKEYLLRVAPSSSFEPEGSRPPRSFPKGPEPTAWSEALASRNIVRIAALLGMEKGRHARVESAFKPYGPGASRVACLGPAADAGGARRASPRYSTDILSASALGDGLELLAALDLGFRHQIRAQLAWIGLPILGDPLYGGRPAQRLFLHALRLRFRHPLTGRDTMIEI
jgi:23S rRNA-/tRNA-specific pseudouridylate synthase